MKLDPTGSKRKGNEVVFQDQGIDKTIELINAGSIGTIFLIRDGSGNALKVIRTISATEIYAERRARQFAVYQTANAREALLKAGDFSAKISIPGQPKANVHIVESFSYSNSAQPTTLQDYAKTNDPLNAFTALSASLQAIHRAGTVVTNLKPDSIHIESKSDGGLYARLVNPSLFSRSKDLDKLGSCFTDYFAGSTPLRYYGEDFLAAFNKDEGANKSPAIANKTDLLAFGVLLFQSLTSSQLYRSDGNAGQVFNKEGRATELAKQLQDGVSSRIDSFLANNMVADHIKLGNHVKNLFAWAVSAGAHKEIDERLEKALGAEGKSYSAEKRAKIISLIKDLITLKEVDGKYIMARSDGGGAPTAEWVHKEMQEIAK